MIRNSTTQTAIRNQYQHNKNQNHNFHSPHSTTIFTLHTVVHTLYKHAQLLSKWANLLLEENCQESHREWIRTRTNAHRRWSLVQSLDQNICYIRTLAAGFRPASAAQRVTVQIRWRAILVAPATVMQEALQGQTAARKYSLLRWPGHPGAVSACPFRCSYFESSLLSWAATRVQKGWPVKNTH